MSKKSHDRDPNKRNFSVALPITLIEDLQRIADKETRSRNMQIQHFLEIAVNEYKSASRSKLSMVAEDAGNESSRSTRADGAPGIKYPTARKRKA